MAIAPHQTPLGRLLADEIREGGPMPFARFMARCLYDPGHGYYSRATRAPGRAGDFYTSVSVGPVLGDLLADHAASVWQELDRADPFHLIEQGAHDGQLMADVLGGLERSHPALARIAAPVIIEPLPSLRKAQQNRLGHGSIPVRWVSGLAELAAAPLTGLFFCNELLDAFPVERLRFDGSHWRRLGVGLGGGESFAWVALEGPLPPEIAGVVRRLRTDVPSGYTTEASPAVGGWVREAAAALAFGRVLVFDYAREAEDYFAHHRTDGTLRGYVQHRRCDDPLARPGETDLTADVNATHLREAAVCAGFTPGSLLRQETFLTSLAAPRLRALEIRLREAGDASPNPADRAWLRQFQTLIHPVQLGRAFSVIELRK